MDESQCSATLTPKAVSIRTAAELMSISERQVYYLLSRGELDSVLLGHRRLILLEQIDDLLARHAVPRAAQ